MSVILSPDWTPSFWRIQAPQPGLIVSTSSRFCGSEGRVSEWLDGRFRGLEELKLSRGSSVYKGVCGGQRFVVKCYEDRGYYVAAPWFGGYRVEREFEAIQWLAERAGNPVQTLALAVRREGLRVRSVIVTSEFSGSVPLRSLQSCEEKALIPALSERLVALHDAGVFAKTLYGKNVLLQRESGRLAIIDLPRARLGRVVSESERVFDLACLMRDSKAVLSERGWRDLFERLHIRRPFSEEPERVLARVREKSRRLAHRTPVSRMLHNVGKRLRRSAPGRWLGLK